MINDFENMKNEMHKTWHERANKKLVGRKIVKVKWLDPENTYRTFGWTQQPCEIHLDDGTILTPSCDDEGNEAGALFTNLKGLECLPTFRDDIDEDFVKKEDEKNFKLLQGSKT